MNTLAEKVRFLSDPAAYEGATRHVEARETHMSWVFLTDDRVYKLKKPVRYPFLDFGTLARRRFFCEEELRLNRRLAAPTYRAVVPLRRDAKGRLTLSGGGRAVEWLVEMKRLPQADMLDARIARDAVSRDDIAGIGNQLTNFYAGLPPEIADGAAYPRRLAQEHVVNRSILARPELGLSEIAAGTLDHVEHALTALAPDIEARIARGRVVEAHGDLRPEHVCLADPPQIIDCLEFNRSMRIVDPYDEVNYLALECELLGAPWIRPLLLGIITERLGDSPGTALMALYGAFRMLLRARLSIAHLLESPVRHPEKWRPLAIRYIEMAERECLNLPAR